MIKRIQLVLMLIIGSGGLFAQNCSVEDIAVVPGGDFFEWTGVLPNKDKISVSLLGGGTNSKSTLLAKKFDSAGNTLWIRPLKPLDPNIGLFGIEANVTPGGGVVLTGNRDNNPISTNSFGLELDGAGNFVWARIYQAAPMSFIAIGTPTPLPGGGFICSSPQSTGFVWLDSMGVPVNAKRLTKGALNENLMMSESFTNAVGETYFVVRGNATHALVKMDAGGNLDPTFAGITPEIRVEDVIELNSGDLVLAGFSSSGDPAVQKMDALGSSIWSNAYFTNSALDVTILDITGLDSGDLLVDVSAEDQFFFDEYVYPASIDVNGIPGEYWDSDTVGMTYFGYYKNGIIGSVGDTVYYAGSGLLNGQWTSLMITSTSPVPNFSCTHGSSPAAAYAVVTPFTWSNLPGDSLVWSSETLNSWLMAFENSGSSQAGIDLNSTIVSGPFRPGFVGTYLAQVSNVAANLSGDVSLYLVSDTTLSYISASPVPTNVSGDTLFWNGVGQLAGNSFLTTIQYQVPPDVTLLGDTIYTTLVAFQDSVENTLTNNTYTDCDIITGAYDPNDKLVEPEGVFDIQNDSTLFYTIRFQNTGTDTAFNVVIVDTLPTEISVSTFIPGPSSHPYSYELGVDGILTFTFANILLPDSNINEPLSHGLVSFTVRPDADLIIGTLITNEADIFFDFNPPIHTPPAIVSYGIVNSVPVVFKNNELSVYPVPVADYLTLEKPADFQAKQLLIYSVDGRLMQSSRADYFVERAIIPMDALTPGQYIITLVDAEGKRLSARFVKE